MSELACCVCGKPAVSTFYSNPGCAATNPNPKHYCMEHSPGFRPQQSAEPVAYRVAREPFQVEKDGEPFAYSTKYMNGMWQPLFAASPGPSVAELEKLEMDLRAEAHKLVPMEYASRGLYEKFYRMDTEAAGLVEAADRLSALIRGNGK